MDPISEERIAEMQARRDRAIARLEALSPAERKVFDVMLQGGDSFAIAVKLGRAQSTVRNQLISIFGKMGMNSRLEILAAFVVPPDA